LTGVVPGETVGAMIAPEIKKPKRKWTKPAYKDVRLGFEYTMYAMTR